jgi:RecB family endonuclease NucS
MNSRSEQFDVVGNDLNAAERLLIQQRTPCFNISLNDQPTPLPPAYQPPSAKFRCSRSLNKLKHEAERAVKAEDAQLWIQEMK